MQIVGQAKLRQWAVKTTALPRCILLVGPRGSGKTLLSKYISDCHGMDFYEVPGLKVDDVRAIIEDAQALARPRLYHFERADKMTNAAQNALLKISEEPPKNVYILIAVENEDNMLPTIKSRSRTLFMEPCTKQDLLDMGFEQEIVDIADNIGQAQQINETDCAHLFTLTKTIATNIGKASLANVFNITRKVKEDEIDLFTSFLLYQFSQEMKDSYQRWHTMAVAHIYTAKQLIQKTNVNKMKIVEMMCMEIWREHRNEIDG